jgi:DNA repair exonuclease SbcCD nuclease subunit
VTRILHLADLHIGYCPGFLKPEKSRVRSEDFKSAFERAVGFALKPENAIKAVIIAGDLFDCPAPDEAVRGFVRAQLGRLSTASIPVLIIPGTHDTIALPESVYRKESFPSNVHILAAPFLRAPLELVLNGAKFYFYWLTYEPHEKRTVAEFLTSVKTNLPQDGYRVFMAHASLKGSPEWDVRRKDLPVSLEDLLSSGMHYVALGHYHDFFESRKGTYPPGEARRGEAQRGEAQPGEIPSAETKVVYPGTLEGKAFGENGSRYLVVVNFDNGRAQVEKHPFNKRVLEEKVISLDSEPVSSEEELLERLESLGNETLLLKLTLTGNPDFVVRSDFLTEALAGKFFHVEIEDATSALGSLPVEEILHEKTIRGMFVRKLKEAISAIPGPDKSGGVAPERVAAERGAFSGGSSEPPSEDATCENAASKRAIYELALKEGLSAFAEKGIVVRARKECKE